MKVKVIKSKNGCSLLQYPSGTYGIEYSDASLGYGMKYTDSKSEANKFFKKVSSDTSSKSISHIRKQSKGQSKTKNFRIVRW